MDKHGLRRENLRLLRMGLLELRQATKPQLAKRLNLSVVTVNALLQDLLQQGEAERVMEAISSGGRPAEQYRYVSSRKLVLTACLHEQARHDMLSLALVDLLGECHPLVQTYLPEVTVERLGKILAEYASKYSQIIKVLIGLPGVEQGGILRVIDYPELKNQPLAASLQKLLGKPVEIVNDINATIVGRGAALGSVAAHENIIGVYWPQQYPPGAGILLEGRLYKGRDGMAGEIGQRFGWPGQAAENISHEEQLLFMCELLTRMWNPHRLVFYDERLTEEKLQELSGRLAKLLPEWVVPQLELRQQVHEDFHLGMHAMAGQILQHALEHEGMREQR